VTDSLTAAIGRLCRRCNLCCNGVLFADVKLQPDDAAGPLIDAGIPVRKRSRGAAFQQPCPALEADGCCRVYGERPARCREFVCRVLQRQSEGTLGEDRAARIIGKARRQADRIIQLLRASGNSDESAPLTRRYQAVMRTPVDLSDPEAGDRRGELMMAVHELMDLARREFLT